MNYGGQVHSFIHGSAHAEGGSATGARHGDWQGKVQPEWKPLVARVETMGMLVTAHRLPEAVKVW